MQAGVNEGPYSHLAACGYINILKEQDEFETDRAERFEAVVAAMLKHPWSSMLVST